VVTIMIGQYVFVHLWRWFESVHTDEFEFSLILIFGLIYAAIAELLGLHFILGAFMAGLFFNKNTPNQRTYTRVKEQFSGLSTGFLAPIFFASIGMNVDFSAVFASPLFLLGVILAAFAGKLIGAGIVGYSTLGLGMRQATAVGFGMSGRGAVELIIANIALRAGLFSGPQPVPPIIANLFSSVVLMAVITTLVAPVILKKTLK
jgi:Kef-type K+ transport system membrane component KefB